MKTEVEISRIDRKHEVHRIRAKAREKVLLASLVERGIDEPLTGVITESGQVVLLDGFKRLRCAVKIGLGLVPFVSLGLDEAEGILTMIRSANAKALTHLEQAAFVEELRKTHGLQVDEIARRLDRSKAWVLVRLRTVSEMSEATAEALLSGKFPMSSYFYTLHPVRRLTTGMGAREIDEFVALTAGKELSTRDIECLADAYFKGGEEMRGQIRSGDLGWTVSQLKEQRRAAIQATGLSESEQKVIRDLEIVHGCMGRLTLKLARPNTDVSALAATASIICDGILGRIAVFEKELRGFYDRIRKT